MYYEVNEVDDSPAAPRFFNTFGLNWLTTSKRLAQGKLVDAILPGGVLSASKSTLVH
jgi:hypothetical protein